MMKRLFAFGIFGVCASFLSIWGAVTPASGIPTYYAAVDGKSGKSLFDEVHDIAKLGYHSLGYDGLWSAYTETDLRADGTIWDMYSDCEFTLKGGKCGNYKNECDCYNREHSIPKSWFGGGTSGPGCDIFHLVPTDGKVNGMRSNNPFGEVGTASYTSHNGSKLGTARSITMTGKTVVSNSGFTATCSDKVFEPVDEYKGDFARAYFGAMIKWADDYAAFTQSGGNLIFSGNYTVSGNFGLSKYGVALLLKWHRQDPVSQKEIDRNNGIQKTQGNRNPFIDYPYLAEYIWGVHAGENVDMEQLLHSQDERFVPGESDGSMTVTEPTLMVSTNELAFAGVAKGTQAVLSFTLRGIQLTQQVSLSVLGTDATLFSVTPATIGAGSANGTHTIQVTYRPVQDGSHQALLRISSQGATPVEVRLYGSCEKTCTVLWLVDGQEYTDGNPTVAVATGTHVTVLPKAPTSCSSESETFVGWSEYTIGVPQDKTPEDLFSDADEAPVVNHNVAYHAVFAHLTTTGGDTPETLTLAKDNTTGWTIDGTNLTNSYWKLVADAYIESPEVDLSGLLSIKINMRTLGGAAYKTVDISCGGQKLGELSAGSNSLKDYTWTPSAPLSGKGAIRFSSTTNTASSGPAVGGIVISSEGTKYTYSRFMTACTESPTENVEISEPTPQVVKIIRNGQLLILYGGKAYNVFGQPVEVE